MKTHLRYELDAALGVVVSGTGQIDVDAAGRHAFAPALEAVVVWDLKTGSRTKFLVPQGANVKEVTALTLGADGETLAVGHGDGAIRVWHLSGDTERVTLNGHSSAVIVLRMNDTGTVLVSGSRDTSVVVWDLVAESGICRLRGHRDAVTDVCLLPAHHALASVSKDGTLRLWDLHTQHCVQNVTTPSGELWSVDADAACTKLLTGGTQAEVLAWKLETTILAKSQPAPPSGAADASVGVTAGDGAGADTSGGDASAWRGVRAVQHGPLVVRASSSRVARLRFGLDDTTVAIQFADRNLAVYGVQNDAQLKRQLQRRAAKRRKQAAQGTATKDGADDGETAEVLAAADCFQALAQLRASDKLHSFAFMPPEAPAPQEADADGTAGGGVGKRAATTARLLLADRSNRLEVHTFALQPAAVSSVVGNVTLPGHRAEARGLAMSADERLVLTASDGEAKLWSVKTRNCLSTLACGYGLSVAFILASKYVAIGTKSGSLQVFGLASAALVCEISDAHAAAIWSLNVQPGGTKMISGSADKTIALWAPSDTDGQFSLDLVQRHELGEDVLCVAYTPSAKYVAVALLDASIHILFADSFQLFLTMYGHKLPVLSVSAASDNTLLVSGSADKTIKLWGLDFGDCHRSLTGHDESVMSVAFVHDTHYFFSASKDGTIRYWDADSFDHILTLRGHHADVWGIVPSRSGKLLASVSRDRSLRLWTRTDDQVFVQEEREAELDQLFDAGLQRNDEDGPAGAAAREVETAGRRSMDSVKGAERVLEALKTLREESDRQAEHAAAVAAAPANKPPVLVPNLLLLGLNEGAYLIQALSSVRATELEQALLLLPFDAAKSMLGRLLPMLPSAPPAELVSRCVLFLVKMHHKQIVLDRSIVLTLNDLDRSLAGRLAAEQELIGYNLAAMRCMRSADHSALAVRHDTVVEATPVEEVTATAPSSRVAGTKKKKRERPARGSE